MRNRLVDEWFESNTQEVQDISNGLDMELSEINVVDEEEVVGKAEQRKNTPVFSGVVIPNYGGRYMINSYGDILSVNRSKLLRPHKSKSSGYFMCTLINEDGGKDVCYLHQLMAVSFLDKDYKSKGLVVDHIDRNKSNNDISNLRVVTSSINNENRKSKGYYYCETRDRFSVQVRRNGVTYKKRFKNENEAIEFIKNIKKNDK